MWDVTNIMLRRKFIVVNVHIKKREKDLLSIIKKPLPGVKKDNRLNPNSVGRK